MYTYVAVGPDSSAVDLAALNYRPSFFNFVVEDYEEAGYEPSNYHKASTLANHMPLISTIRTILDCMLRAFELEGAQVADFPEFVYSWLENFTIDQASKSVVKKAKEFESKVRFEFYTGLMSESLNENWEVVAFREFLVESCSLEELYCYLKMREHLFSGEISGCLKAHYEDVLYVECSKMDSLLNLFLPDMDRVNLSYLKNIIKSSAVSIKDRKFLNSGFLLRICLEYYKMSRTDLYRAMAEEFRAVDRGANPRGLTKHRQFMAYVGSFYPELSSLERIRLYRDCFAAGAGAINVDVFFVALSEKRILLRKLVAQLRGKTAKPLLQPYKFITECQGGIEKLFECGFFSRVMDRFGVESLACRNWAYHSPEELLEYSESAIRVMFYKVKKLLSSGRVELHSCSSIFNGALLYMRELYGASIAKEECLAAKEYVATKQLALALERLFIERNEAFNSHVIRMLSEVKVIAPRRKFAKRLKNAQRRPQPEF